MIVFKKHNGLRAFRSFFMQNTQTNKLKTLLLQEARLTGLYLNSVREVIRKSMTNKEDG